MTRRAVIIEIEELLFDTRDMRVDALQAALLVGNVVVSRDDVLHAHAGRPAIVALTRLDAASVLDATARELVLRRAADHVQRSLELQAPSFDAAARDALQQLAAEYPLGVVTRATRADAARLLELAGLDTAVAVVRSVDERDESRQHEIWSDVLMRLHATHGIAIAPEAMLPAARRAGLRTVAVDMLPSRQAGAAPWNARLASLSCVNASFIASLT